MALNPSLLASFNALTAANVQLITALDALQPPTTAASPINLELYMLIYSQVSQTQAMTQAIGQLVQSSTPTSATINLVKS